MKICYRLFEADIATEIVKDHLIENSRYYDKLTKLEHFFKSRVNPKKSGVNSNYVHSIHEAVNELILIYQGILKTTIKNKNKILSKLKNSLQYLIEADNLISIETGNQSVGERLKIR
jgi:hypothetical protein